MNTKEAIAKRVIELCQKHDLAINALANSPGVSPSTVYSMLNEKAESRGCFNKKLCDGLGKNFKRVFR